MKNLLRTILLTLACTVAALAADPALPFLCPLFGEHMMLQRGRPNPVWGWAKPGTAVKITLAGRTATATAGPDGRWQAELEPPAAGGPYTLTVDGGPEPLQFKDVLVGDLWLCSGQSNMGFGLAGSRDGAEAVKNSTHELIRLFLVPQRSAYAPLTAPEGSWRRCEPASFTGFGGFSAVAYFFARKVQAETGVPIGLIEAAIGGVPAESWMSPESMRTFPEFAPGLAELARLHARGAPVYGNYIMHWYDEYDRSVAGHWSEEKADDHAWTPASLHDVFAKLGVPTAPAVVWLRREIDLPDPLPAGMPRIMLGVVEKMDTVWINGRHFGASAWVENPRSYPDFRHALRPGRNQITVRVLKTAADGGFRSPPESLRLQIGDNFSVPLEDGWRAMLGVDARPPHPLPPGYENWPNMPAVLHLGMLRPLALTGALWYQGEANQTRPTQYRTVPHTGVAITVDTGDADNIHPIDKLPVGERLALLALRDVYRKDVVSQGPVFDHTEILPSALRVRFTHTDGGLVVKGDRLGEFAVAGPDRIWHWAQAKVDGDTVIVSASAVPAPVAVRYAWQANPLANLFNGAGLPAAPFRSDDWPAAEVKKLWTYLTPL